MHALIKRQLGWTSVHNVHFIIHMKSTFSHKILTCGSLLMLFWDKHVLLTYKAHINHALFSPQPSEIISCQDPIHSLYSGHTVLLAVPPARSPFPASLPSLVLLLLPGCFTPQVSIACSLFSLNALWKCHFVRELFPDYLIKNTTVFAGPLPNSFFILALNNT